MKERVKVKGVEMTFRKALSEVQINNETIFQAGEQGYGFKNEDILFIIILNIRNLSCSGSMMNS